MLRPLWQRKITDFSRWISQLFSSHLNYRNSQDKKSVSELRSFSQVFLEAVFFLDACTWLWKKCNCQDGIQWWPSHVSCNRLSSSPVKIHATSNQVAPALALTSLVDYKSEQLLVFLSLFPTLNKLVLQLVAEDGWHFHGFSHSGSMGPTTLVLAVVVEAALLVYSQTRAFPRVSHYGSNVHVRGR